MRVLLLLMLTGVALAEEFPLKMAREGRLQLVVPADGKPLSKVSVSAGTVGRGSWREDEQARDRLVDVSFAVDWWRWRDLTVTFTPESDGWVELHLTGPWAEKSPGALYRQEVLWDDVKAKGTTVKNGGFASMDGWDSPWREYPDAEAWPVNGIEVGASWHARPLVQRLAVNAGKVVKISLKVKSAVTPGFVEPARLKGESAAHRANARMKRGVNLGNCWEAPPGSWGLHFDASDVDRIAAAGFDHIRVPVGWHYRMKDGKISPEFLAELEPVLKRALEKKLIVMMDWHNFGRLTSDPSGKKKAFVAGWRAIAEHFAEWPPELYFELLNEPCDKLEGVTLNEVHAPAIAAIRESNPNRILVVNPGSWSSTDALGDLNLPADDRRIIVTFHCYDPFKFTHQGASWVDLEDVKDIGFPGSLKLEHEQRIDDALAWSKRFGRPVHLGEFGAYRTADIESRRRYAKAVRSAAEARGIPWCWWEWKAGFGCWDGEKNEPVLIDSLIGNDR